MSNHVNVMVLTGSGTTDFQPQLNNINKDMFTLIAWDPRGYGKSQESPRDWVAHFLERDAHDAAKLMHVCGFVDLDTEVSFGVTVVPSWQTIF